MSRGDFRWDIDRLDYVRRADLHLRSPQVPQAPAGPSPGALPTATQDVPAEGVRVAYDADVHYGEIKALALKAGFRERIAEDIARSSERPDTGDRDPLRDGKTLYFNSGTQQEQDAAASRLREWHFPRDPGASAVVPNSAAARAKLPDAIKSGNPLVLGEALHPLADSWGHQGIPTIDGTAGHAADRGGMLSTKTDHTAAYPNDALAMSRETYRALVEFGNRNPDLRDKEPARFHSFRSELDAFINADTKEEKRKALQEGFGVTMPKQLWDDVSLPKK